MSTQVIPKIKNSCEALGLLAFTTPFIKFNSASRIVMDCHHQQQAPTVGEPDLDRCLTGFEDQMITYDIVMPTNALIISVHRKYPPTIGRYSIRENSLTTIIFRCQDTGIYDTLDISTHHSKHMTYGSKYVITPLAERLSPGDHVKKGTILAYSPAKINGLFSAGLSCSVINMSHFATEQDGFAVSESFCKRGRLLELPVVVGSWGSKTYPLNLYGDEYTYKPFPDIGDKIREDGLVLAFREYDPMYDALDMGVYRLTESNEVSATHDIKVYSTPGATVYDIEILSNIEEPKSKPNTPEAIAGQPNRYLAYTINYYNGILSVYDSIKGKPETVISHKLNQLIVRALGDRPNSRKTSGGGIIRRTIKRVPLDEYNIKIRARYQRVLSLGSKIAGKHGNKGVICHIMKDKDRPIDIDGNIVDVICHQKGIAGRMNCGQIYEQWITAVSRDLSKLVKETIEKNINPEEVINKLMRYYSIIMPLTEKLLKKYTEEEMYEHLLRIGRNGIYNIIPPDNDYIGPDIYEKILDFIVPVYDRIWYTDAVGRRVRTKTKVFVGIEQFLVLEKSDQQPMAVSSATLQPHGLLARSSKANRGAHPGKIHPIKNVSETEGRILANYTGGYTFAKFHLISNSPEAHAILVEWIMRSNAPTRLPELKLPMESGRPRRFITSVFTGFGVEIVNSGDSNERS